MKKLTKRICLVLASLLALILVLVLVFVLLFPSIMKYNSYRYFEKDGQFYIRFDPIYRNYVKGKKTEPLLLYYIDRMDFISKHGYMVEGYGEISSIRFDSVAEMKNDILTGNFTDNEWTIIHESTPRWIPENLFTGIQLKVFNLTNLYEPVCPSTFTVGSIYWNVGSEYSFSLESQSESYFGSQFFVIPQSSYTKTVNKLMDSIQEYPNVSIVKIPDYDVAEYHFVDEHKNKQVIYQFENNGATYTVCETYYTKQISGYRSRFLIYGETQGQCFYVSFLEKDQQRPSIAFLSQFGIKKLEG